MKKNLKSLSPIFSNLDIKQIAESYDAILLSCSLSSKKSKQNIYQYERIQELGYAKFLVRSENQLRSRSHSVKKVALN